MAKNTNSGNNKTTKTSSSISSDKLPKIIIPKDYKPGPSRLPDVPKLPPDPYKLPQYKKLS